VALVCLDRNFDKCENVALYALTDILKECKNIGFTLTVMMEVGKEIKGYTELTGRTDSNMIDALNAMYNYGMTKEKMKTHM
jgi:hypothetical protein